MAADVTGAARNQNFHNATILSHAFFGCPILWFYYTVLLKKEQG